MKWRTIAALVALTGSPFATPLGAQTASSVASTIDRAVAAWSKARTARAEFDQTITNSLTGGSSVAHGEFLQQRPNRLAIRFAEDGGRVVSDGKYLWVYLPASAPGQVIKRLANDGSGAPIDITGQFLDEPRAKYDIAEAGHVTTGEPARVLTLVPKDEQSAPFVRAKVWVSDRDALIREFEVVEKSGVTRHVRLTTLELNVPVDRAAFTYVAPRGVRVIDQTK